MSGRVRMTCASGDRAAAAQLADALRQAGTEIEVEVEFEDNGAPADRRPRADTLVFLVSGESIASAGCLRELERAVASDARVVPVVLEHVDHECWPGGLADRQWIVVAAASRDALWLGTLVQALKVDPQARDRHERLAVRTLEWVAAESDRSLLLRGTDLVDAEAWLGDEANHGQTPTDREARFIADSRRAATVRQRTRLGAALGALIVTLALAVVALAQRQQAANVEREATSHGLAAQALTVADRDPALAAALSVEAQRADATREAADAARVVLGRLGPAIGTLTGHTNTVLRVAIGGPRDLLASASHDGTVRLWDVATRHQIGAPLRGHRGSVFGVAVSRDGRLVASGGADGTVRLWSVARHRALGAPLRHAGTVASVAFSPDGSRLASAGGDGSVRIWDVARRRASGEPLRGHSGGVLAVAFSPDGRTVASGGVDATVRLWNVARGRASGAPMRGHTGLAAAIAFSPDARTLASGSLDGNVRLWDLAAHRPAGAPLRPVRAPALVPGLQVRQIVGAVAFSPDGATLASADSSSLRRWDVSTHAPIGVPIGGSGGLALAYDAAGTTLASAAALGGAVLLSNVARSTQAAAAAQRLPHQPRSSDGAGINSSAISANGRMRVSGDDGQLRVWRVSDNSPVGVPIDARSGAINSVATTADGSLIATGADDGTARLWRTSTSRQVGPTLRGHVGRVWSVSFSPDGKILASGGRDHRVRLWDVTTGQLLVAPLRGHTGSVHGVAFSPDGATLASGGDNTVRLWRVATGKPIGSPLRRHSDGVQRVVFSPDGRLLASSAQDRSIRLWDIATHRAAGAPLTSETDVKPLAFSPDSRTLASAAAGFGADVRLWDVASHAAIGSPLTHLGNGIVALAFKRGGSDLLIVDNTDNESILASILWSGDAGARNARLCASARRDLTRAEWRTYLPGRPYRRTCTGG